MRIGMRMVMMTKLFARMRSRYSRLATSQTLCIDFFSYGFDEDLLEGGLHNFEAGDASAALDGGGEERLGVGTGSVEAMEFNVGLAAVVLRGFDARMLEERIVAFEGDLDAVARVAALDVAHTAGEDEMAAGDEGDSVADFFDLIHAVGAEEDGLALLAEVNEGIHQKRGVDGIEAAEGLVHDDEVGLVEEGGDELDLLLHALGELFGFLGDGVGDLHALAPDVGAFAGGGGVEAVQLAQEDELVHDFHLLVEAAFFREVADAVEELSVEWPAEEIDGAGVRHGNSDHHPDAGGLAGAVGAEKAEHAAWFNGEAEVCDGDLGIVCLTDMLHFYDGHGFSCWRVMSFYQGMGATQNLAESPIRC